MKGLTLNLGGGSAEKIAHYIRDIAEGVSEEDIVEVVLKPSVLKLAKAPRGKMKKDDRKPIMTSREIAEILGKPHAVIFNKMSRFLWCDADSTQEKEFRLSSFKIPQGIEYPMYELSEKACDVYCNWVCSHNNYKTVADSMERLKKAVHEKFHSKKRQPEREVKDSGFLLSGEARKDCKKICDVFDEFITGPGLEGREIKELTESYQQFYSAMQIVGLDLQDKKKLESALAGVAIESEMQGFIYGFRMFEEMIMRRIPEMQEVVV